MHKIYTKSKHEKKITSPNCLRPQIIYFNQNFYVNSLYYFLFQFLHFVKMSYIFNRIFYFSLAAECKLHINWIAHINHVCHTWFQNVKRMCISQHFSVRNWKHTYDNRKFHKNGNSCFLFIAIFILYIWTERSCHFLKDNFWI